LDNSIIPHIPNAELQVMKVVWDASASLSARQIIQKIQKEINPAWKVATIRTLIDRLVAKGCLAVEQCSRERYYTATIDEQTYLEETTKKFLSQHYSGSFFQLFVLLVGDRLARLTTEEIQQVEYILSKLDVK